MKSYQDEELLRQKYLIEMKPAWRIAQELHASRPTILAWLRKYNIPIRRTKTLSPEHVQKAVSARKTNGYKHSVETKRKISEARLGWKMEDDVKFRISETLKGHPYWSVEHHTAETKRKIGDAFRGEKCHLWKGGISFEPYCPKFNDDLRRRIRAFFDNICVICGKSSKENGEQLSCHHVEYNKSACCDGKPVQFAALCHSCHTRTTNDRERWELVLHRIIDEMYGSRSYYTKEEYQELISNEIVGLPNDCLHRF